MTHNLILICPHCGKPFNFDPFDAHKYKGKYLCFDCFDYYYGYCNECGELFKYDDMNDDIICRECETKNLNKIRSQNNDL